MNKTWTVYRFKVALKHNKRIWRRIDILENQKIGDFDMIIREAFEHDTWDHLSEFFRDKAWESRGFGEIEPEGRGRAAQKKISGLGFVEGDIFEYVYDFGDNIEHIIKVEKIFQVDEKGDYPTISGRNKPKYQLCECCLKNNKETVATWYCTECSDRMQRDVFLCEDCLMKYHEDHFAEKILY